MESPFYIHLSNIEFRNGLFHNNKYTIHFFTRDVRLKDERLETLDLE